MQKLDKICNFEVTDVRNMQASESNIKKLKGDFRLQLNHRLSMPKKIEQFAVDPVSFYLHKQRNFVRKIDEQMADLKYKEIQDEQDEKLRKLEQHIRTSELLEK